MEDNRKLAVAFGNFACVVEGYDQPFKIVQRVVRFFEDQAAANPGFGDWNSIADGDDLKARLEGFGGVGNVEIESMPGGIRVRRLLSEVAATDAAVADENVEDAPEEVAQAEETGPQEQEPAALGSGSLLSRYIDTAYRPSDREPQPEAADATDDAVADDSPGAAEAAEAKFDDSHVDDSDDDAPNPFVPEPAGDAMWSSAPAEAEVEAGEGDAKPEAETDDDTRPDYISPFAEDLDTVATAEEETPPQPDDAAEDAEEEDTDDDTWRADAAAAWGPEDLEGVSLPEEETTGHDEAVSPSASQVDDDDDDVLEDDEDRTLSSGFHAGIEAEADTEAEAEAEAEQDNWDETESQAGDQGRIDQPLRLDRGAGTDAGARNAGPMRLGSPAAPARQPGSPAAGPLRLGGEPPAPLRLGDVAASTGAPAPGNADPESANRSRPLFRRLSQGSEDAPGDGNDESAGKQATIRLGGDMAEPPNSENRPSFIDTIAPTEDQEPESTAKPSPAPDDAEIMSEMGKALNEEEPAGRKTLLLGGLLRRKPAAEDAADDSGPAASEAPQRVPDGTEAGPEDSEAAEGAPPRKPGSLLRVVAERGRPADQDAGADTASPTPQPAPEAEEPEAAKPAASRGFRSFLRGKPARAEESPVEPAEAPAAPEPQEEPAVTTAPEPPAAKPTDSGGDRVKDRLMASFAEAPEPATKPTFDLDAPDDEEIDPFSPLGFAQRSSARSLPELMTAATAYLNIVEGKPQVSRNDIVAIVEQIAGDTPLTAKAKVEAVGKLVRAGTLIRLEGGMFMIDEIALQRFREAMEGAA